MRRRYALIGWALAACAISNVLATANASAVTLPELTVNAFVTATFGKSTLSATGGEITSEKGILDGSEEINKKSGRLVIWLLKAALAGQTCNSKGASAENVLIPVTWDAVPWGHTTLMVLLIEKTVTIECKLTTVELLEGSDLLGEISPANTTTSKFRFELKAPEKKQAFKEFENDEGKAVKAELKVKVNHGTTTAGTADLETATIVTRESKEESGKEVATELKAVPPETQKISLKPIQLGGKCPEEGGRVAFSITGEKCEYKLENENATERIEVRVIRMFREAQCNGALTWCIDRIATESSPTCSSGTLWGTQLAPGGVCYLRLEYKWKPEKLPAFSNLEVITRSTLGGEASPVENQVMK